VRIKTPLSGFAVLAMVATVAAAPVVPQDRAGAQGRSGIVRVDAAMGEAADDTDFLFRLGLMEGHLIVGHELLLANKPEMALPHFGHPVRELYDDVSDYLDRHHFPAFDKQLARLEASVAAAPTSPDTLAQYQAAIATIHKARDLTPASIRASVPTMIKICAETVDAASGEFNGALERGRVASLIEYHDSRGFLSYVRQEIKNLTDTHADPQAQGMLTRFRDVLAKAEWIVEPLLPDPTPRASVGQFRAIAAQAATVAKGN
jgi:hypothetical protein